MPAKFASLDDMEREAIEMGSCTPEYWDKQVHAVPASKEVNRHEYLMGLCHKKTVLHIGCTGPLDKALQSVATKVYGLDSLPLERQEYQQVDLDHLPDNLMLPYFDGVELVVCGEVLEHLSNPGRFLLALYNTYPVPVALTVPNAFAIAGQQWLMKRGRENVNRDHVCYYSYTTLKQLLWRARYEVKQHYWYGGKPYISEGLIVLAVPVKD